MELTNKELIYKWKWLFDTLKFQKSLKFRLDLLRLVENEAQYLKNSISKVEFKISTNFTEYGAKLLMDLYETLGFFNNNPIISVESMKT